MAERDTDKYIISNTAVPPRQRDRFRALRRPETYRNLKTREPEVGESGVYVIELTPSEVRDLERDRPSNLRHLEKAPPMYTPDVDAVVPGDEDLRGSKADKLFEWGFTGRGIDVGVIDTGLGAAVSKKFNIKAIRSEADDSPYQGSHGSYTSSVAVPRASRLVFSRAIDEIGQTSTLDGTSWIKALYWMVDEIGVHAINVSFGAIRDYVQAEQDAVTHAKSKGVTIYASAGNDNVYAQGKYYPGNYANLIAVGALDRARGWARAQQSDWGSNWGPYVDLWANGVNVKTYGPDGSITYKNGTSLAAPLVVYTKAALLTKGLKSIGELNTQQALKKGDGAVPADEAHPDGPKAPASGVPIGLGGGARLNGEGGAWAMRDFCG
jgi:hypothetical protein